MIINQLKGILKMITYILYGLPKDEMRDYMEVILTETKNLNHVEKAKAWAISQGFKNIRLATHVEGEKPNFLKAINIL